MLLLICFISHLYCTAFNLQVNFFLTHEMCLNNCKLSNDTEIEYDPLEIDCFNPSCEDNCNYLEMEETNNISYNENDLIVV